MYRILYKDSDGSIYADTATAIYEGTCKGTMDGEWMDVNGVWITLTDDDDRIFITTEDAKSLIQSAFANGFIDTRDYGFIRWESEMDACI